MYTFEKVKDILSNIRTIQTEILKLKFEIDEVLNEGSIQAITYEEKIKGYSENKGVESSIIKVENIREDVDRRIKEKELLLRRIDISLGALFEVERKVIVMGYYDGFNDTSIAYSINRTNQSVSLIRRRAIKKMVDILNI